MSTKNLPAEYVKFAGQDLRRAKRDGVAGVLGTKEGDLLVTYDAGAGTYALVNAAKRELVRGGFAVVCDHLAGLFTYPVPGGAPAGATIH